MNAAAYLVLRPKVRIPVFCPILETQPNRGIFDPGHFAPAFHQEDDGSMQRIKNMLRIKNCCACMDLPKEMTASEKQRCG